jgi:hypothetical protein
MLEYRVRGMCERERINTECEEKTCRMRKLVRATRTGKRQY